jgi:transcriptional regulator GlxA family with amidase domain
VTVDPAVLFVYEGDILTSAGSAASIDLCLQVVRQDRGTEIATQLARQLVVPTQRDVCVPKTSSKSCDQAIFADQTTDASMPSDPVLTEIGQLG